MLSQFLGQPLALEPITARRYLAGASLTAPPRGARDDKGYDVINGAAVIGVYGLLMPRLDTLRPWGTFATGYDGIRANFAAALDDPTARAIVLHVDSGGGACDGLFDLAQTIYAARSVKPLIAICERAYSAAYSIASSASYLTVPATGGVGSIGIITMLMDQSKALDKAGLAVHFVTFGSKKAADSRAELTGVTEDVLADIQRDIDRLGEMFVSDVARNRGMSADKVRGTEAACFMGSDGVEIGLADRVLSADAAFTAVLADLSAA